MRYAEQINFIQMMLQSYVEQFKESSPVINLALANESTRHWQDIVQALAVYDGILTHKEEANGLGQPTFEVSELPEATQIPQDNQDGE